jgi:hypothetical protein
MKTYKVILKDKREALVDADGHQIEGDQRRFTLNGIMIQDVFFYEEEVVGISIEDEHPGSPVMAVF